MKITTNTGKCKFAVVTKLVLLNKKIVGQCYRPNWSELWLLSPVQIFWTHQINGWRSNLNTRLPSGQILDLQLVLITTACTIETMLQLYPLIPWWMTVNIHKTLLPNADNHPFKKQKLCTYTIPIIVKLAQPRQPEAQVP